MAGFFDEILGGGIGAAPAKGPKGSGAAALFLNSLMPSILQAISSGQMTGQNLNDFFAQFTTDKKGAKGNAFAAKIAKNQFIDVSALSQALPGMLQQAQAAQAKQFQSTYDALSQVPGLAGIFGEAQGNFAPQFTSDINVAYESMGASLLGQGAKSGFLADPNKQATILGPLALDKAMFLKNLQKSAEAQALGLAGAGGLSGSGAANMAQGQQAYLPGVFNSAQLFQGNQQFNANLGFQSSAMQAQQAMAGAGFLQNMLGGAFAGGQNPGMFGFG
jgi:hypothetical protein